MFSWLRHQFVPTLRATFHGWSEDDGPLLSAAMAYYAAFSLFPLCLVLIAILGLVTRFWPKAANAKEELLGLIGDNTSLWLADQLQSILNGVETNAGLGGPIGLATLVIAAIGIFMQLEGIFDRIWRQEPPKQRGILAAVKNALFDRLSAFLMLLGVGGLLVVLMLADVVLAGVRPYVVKLPAGNTAWIAFQLLVSLVLNALLFAILYKVLPKTPIGWREALSGGLLVAVIWEIGQFVLVPLVIGQKYSAYGVVGSFIAVMLWMYYASAVLFLGAEFVQALNRQFQPRMTEDQAGP
jgi:membrane protein